MIKFSRWWFNIRKEKYESGQALVEFALVSFILLLLVFGIIQFGLILNGKITVTSAAREGARLAVVGADVDDVKDRVEDNAVALLLNISRSNIVVTPNYEGDAEKLRVKVTGTVDIIVPFLDKIIEDPYTVSSESIMRVEVAP